MLKLTTPTWSTIEEIIDYFGNENDNLKFNEHYKQLISDVIKLHNEEKKFTVYVNNGKIDNIYIDFKNKFFYVNSHNENYKFKHSCCPDNISILFVELVKASIPPAIINLYDINKFDYLLKKVNKLLIENIKDGIKIN